MIKEIEIENIKGIGAGQYKKRFELDILPNKPSLLIAPNGFGKSSFSTAFKSMNRDRIKLEKKDCHKEDETKLPLLRLKFQQPDNSEIDLQADDGSNTISDYFDYFVISNQVKAKGVGQTFAGRTNVSASLNIDPIILIDSIPTNTTLNYSFTEAKENFGLAGKVIPNLTNIFNCLQLFITLKEPDNITILDRANNHGVKQRIAEFKLRMNGHSLNASKQNLIEFIKANELHFLSATPYLSSLGTIIQSYDLSFHFDKQVENYLTAIELIKLYHSDRQLFKDFCKRKEYESDKISFKRIFEDFNTSWIEFKPKEKDGSLIIEFPKAHLISNGQRDVLSFVALLEKARKKLKKQNCILIIDEVFDYLDDANLVAVQYYTTQFIEEFKASNRNIYPLILSHLDPLYFKGYVFGKKHKLKTYFLAKYDAVVNEQLIKLLKERNKATSIVKDDIEKYLLHYHTNQINRRHDFQALNLKPTWGELNNFDTYIFAEKEKYCNDEEEFDPLAVCCAVRKQVEKKVFDQINDANNRHTFLDVLCSGTLEKLDFAESIGIDVNESYYYLAIVYNEALHWKDDRDKNSNISPAMGKLQNLTIKKLVKNVFN